MGEEFYTANFAPTPKEEAYISTNSFIFYLSIFQTQKYIIFHIRFKEQIWKKKFTTSQRSKRW